MIETELKLRFSPEDEGTLAAQLRELGARAGAVKHLLAVYFDTPDLQLRRDGIAVRVRREGDDWVQTVKGKGALEAGIHRREELNVPVEGPALDPTKLPVLGPLAKFFDDPDVRERLAPVVETDVRRQVWTFESPHGASVECAIDCGDVRAAGKSRSIHELELELIRGQPGDLLSLARELSEIVALQIERCNKADLGYTLIDPRVIAPVFASLPDLDRDMSAEDALRAILSCCLEHFQGNTESVLAGQKEGVHQMRVGIRRLRSCLNVHKLLIPKEVAAPISDETRWLNEALGPVRDLDVFIEGLDDVCAAFPDRRGLSRVRDLCRAEREHRQHELEQRLSSPRYHCMVLSMADWIQNKGWNRDLDAEQRDALCEPVSHHAGRVLAKLYKRMMRDGENFERLSIVEKHALRIRVKRLRYGLQFFSNLYHSKLIRPMVKALGELQEDLGVLNDMYVADTLLDGLGVKSGAARGLLDGWYGARAAGQEVHAANAWKQFVESPIPWKG